MRGSARIEGVGPGYDPLTANLRATVNARLYLEKTGCPWRCLPTDFGAWETVRTWHDRFRADGIWSEVAALLTRAVRQKRGRPAEPATAILASPSVVSGPQAGVRGTDGKKKVRGIKPHVLTCSRGFVLAALVTAANVPDTQAAGWLFDRAAQAGWAPERVKVDGIYTGARMDEAAARHGLDVQISTRELDEKGFRPRPVRWRIEATLGTLTPRCRRLTRHWPHSTAAAEDAISIANGHRLLRAYHRTQDCPVSSNRHSESTKAWILLVRLPRERPMPQDPPPLLWVQAACGAPAR